MPDPSLAERIARLEAIEAIRRLITDLGCAFDAGPSDELLRPLFTADATFVIDDYGTLEGADGIADGVAGNADKGFKWTLHYLVSPRIDLRPGGDVADAHFMLWEAATAASGRAYWIGGSYTALAARDGDAWRFRHLQLALDLVSHYPEGWHEKPAALDQA